MEGTVNEARPRGDGGEQTIALHRQFVFAAEIVLQAGPGPFGGGIEHGFHEGVPAGEAIACRRR